jgi:hypothetical protein
MVRFYPRPDALIDPLPDPIRKAHDAAEEVLRRADGVVVQIAANRAKGLPKALGRLCAFQPVLEAAVRPLEADLADARGFEPFLAMGECFTSAHLAALRYGEAIENAVNHAAHPNKIILVDVWGEEGVEYWTDMYRRHLSECGVITVEGDIISPGTAWVTFHERFRGELPRSQTDELQTHMRLELAAWLKGQKTKQAQNAGVRGAGLSEQWMPAGQAVEQAEQAGFSVTLPWLSRSARKSGIKTRLPELPGRHRLEVEWNSLIVHLAKKKIEGKDAAEPSERERKIIEEEKKKASEKKRRSASLD